MVQLMRCFAPCLLNQLKGIPISTIYITVQGLNQAGMRGVKGDEEYFTAGGNPMIKQIESKMFSDYMLQTRISVGYLIF